MLRKFVLTVLVVAFSASAVACAGGGQTSKPASRADAADKAEKAAASVVKMMEFKYLPGELTLAGGSHITLRNAGAVEHTLTSTDLGLDVKVGAGKSSAVTVPAKPATYEVFCTVPGHKQAGMIGKLTIT